MQSCRLYSPCLGNNGNPLSEAVLSSDNREEAIAICEISSFQAELPRGLNLDALLWLNFAEDHLDRYPHMQAYFSAKANLLKCLKNKAPAVLPTSIRRDVENHFEVQQNYFYPDSTRPVAKLISNSPFVWKSYDQNFSLLRALWDKLDLPESCLQHAANRFRLPKHRLQLIYTSKRLQAWDDSKATNFCCQFSGS